MEREKPASQASYWALGFFILGVILLTIAYPSWPVVLFFVLWVLFHLAIHLAAAPAQNASYADSLFRGLVPFENVEASRRWHGMWDGRVGLDCTYAIVTLTDDAPEAPPSQGRQNGRDWQFTFGGDWRPVVGQFEI